jgi:hypothetical protein
VLIIITIFLRNKYKLKYIDSQNIQKEEVIFIKYDEKLHSEMLSSRDASEKKKSRRSRNSTSSNVLIIKEIK